MTVNNFQNFIRVFYLLTVFLFRPGRTYFLISNNSGNSVSLFPNWLHKNLYQAQMLWIVLLTKWIHFLTYRLKLIHIKKNLLKKLYSDISFQPHALADRKLLQQIHHDVFFKSNQQAYNFLERSSGFGEEVLRAEEPVLQIRILLKVSCYRTYCCYVIQITYRSMKASQREQHSFPPFLNQHFSEKDLY